MSQFQQIKAVEARTLAWALPCQITEGLFPNEVSIRINLHGEGLVAFVPSESVVMYGDIGPDRTSEGQLRVEVLGEVDDRVLVGLPSETLSTGSRLLIDKDLLEEVRTP